MQNRVNNLWSARIKQCLLMFILIPFLLCYVQQVKPFIEVRMLKGYFVPKIYTEANVAGLIEGSYQKTTEEYLNENFGFRSLFVRVNNQIRFSLFNKLSNKSVVMGKDNFLFENAYVSSYTGKDFIGKPLIEETVSKIKFLQDTLNMLGKKLLIVLAPSKARIYPEYISDSLKPNLQSNYFEFLKEFTKQKINYIDFNSTFLRKKESSKYLLYPTLGTHWSVLEGVKAYDTIINYLSALSGLNLPDLIITKEVEKAELEDPDDDMGKNLNMLWLPDHSKMAYPQFVINKRGRDMSNLLVVGDSYWWDIFIRKLPKKTFLNNEFWYYNKEIWGNMSFEKFYVDSVDVKRRVLQTDFIVIVSTEINLNRLGFGFFDLATNALRGKITPTTKELNDYKSEIKNNKEWMDQIKVKAKQKNISNDSMLSLDANWIFQLKGPLRKQVNVLDCKKIVLSSNEWLSEIGKLSCTNNISVDSAICYYSYWYLEKIFQVESNRPKFENEKVGDLAIIQIKELIKHNLEWMKQIKTKSFTKGLSIDSTITLDAIWYKKRSQKKNL
jgi:hypothetical protein